VLPSGRRVGISENRIEYENKGRVVDELRRHRATIYIERMDKRSYLIAIDPTAGEQRFLITSGQNGELELTSE
jgi:hypothetical protein